MDEIHQSFHIVDRGIRQDSVPKIEDVTRLPGGLIEHSSRPNFDRIPGSQQRDRIKIALNGNLRTDVLTRFRQRNSPIDADHVRSAGTHELEQTGGANTEQDDRNA